MPARVAGSTPLTGDEHSSPACARSGHYVLTLDGVDEIPVTSRKIVYEWINQAIGAHPQPDWHQVRCCGLIDNTTQLLHAVCTGQTSSRSDERNGYQECSLPEIQEIAGKPGDLEENCYFRLNFNQGSALIRHLGNLKYWIAACSALPQGIAPLG